jgi:hypothetical protein
MLVELLKPAGPDLARRWLAALLLVDREDRPALVAEIEKRVASVYRKDAPADGRQVEVVYPPVQREGYVEQVTTTYEVKPHAKPAKAGDAKRGGARRASRGG